MLSVPFKDELLSSPRRLRHVLSTDKSAPPPEMVKAVNVDAARERTSRRKSILEEIKGVDKTKKLKAVDSSLINDKSAPVITPTATTASAVTAKAEARQELFSAIRSGVKLKFTKAFKQGTLRKDRSTSEVGGGSSLSSSQSGGSVQNRPPSGRFGAIAVGTSPTLPNPVAPNAVFGVDLTTLLRRYYRQSIGEGLTSNLGKVPLIVEKCLTFIEERGICEGIYRLSGVHGSIQKLKAAFNESEKQVNLETDDNALDVHCVTGVVKLYFRELPNPLLTFDLYDEFLEAVKAPAPEPSPRPLAPPRRYPTAPPLSDAAETSLEQDSKPQSESPREGILTSPVVSPRRKLTGGESSTSPVVSPRRIASESTGASEKSSDAPPPEAAAQSSASISPRSPRDQRSMLNSSLVRRRFPNTPPPAPTAPASAAASASLASVPLSLSALAPSESLYLPEDLGDDVGFRVEKYMVLRLRDVVAKLPLAHHDTLKYLMAHLRRMCQHSRVTNMGVSNLAIVFAPSIMRARGEMAPRMEDMPHTQTVVSVLIAAQPYVFSSASSKSE